MRHNFDETFTVRRADCTDIRLSGPGAAVGHRGLARPSGMNMDRRSGNATPTRSNSPAQHPSYVCQPTLYVEEHIA
jgi:hypothetical protein